MPTTWSNLAECALPDAGLESKRYVNTTSLLLNGSPSLHLSPLRRLNVKVLASVEAVHFSASRGSYSYLSLTISRTSEIRVSTCVSGPFGGASGFQFLGF